MKKYVTASAEGQGYSISDLIYQLNQAQDTVGYLEDLYFGDDAVDDLDKCYKAIEKAIAYADLANAKL